MFYFVKVAISFTETVCCARNQPTTLSMYIHEQKGTQFRVFIIFLKSKQMFYVPEVFLVSNLVWYVSEDFKQKELLES